MEKIEIKDFLGIKDITIEVKQINILIGPQASGKSVIAKLLYYFKYFMSEIYFAAIDEKNQQNFDEKCILKFKEFFPYSSWVNNNFQIKYFLKNEFVAVKRKQEKSSNIILKYSKFYQENFNELTTLLIDTKDEAIQNNYQTRLMTQLKTNTKLLTFFLVDASKELDTQIVAFDQLYIPAGRSFFSNLKGSIFSILSNNNVIDPFLTKFGSYYEKIKEINPKSIQNNSKYFKEELLREINLLNNKILCGKYIQVDGDDYIQISENRIVSVANSSSGQQETLPLSIIMQNIAMTNFDITGISVYIEEPEAHIFPSAQRDMVELIATVYNAQKNSSQFFITTHSPYILTAFNNLLQAGILAVDATEEKIEEINKLVSKTRFLRPEEVAVYSLANGYCKSIMDQETGLIDANVIDEVSNELAVQFDQLLDLEE